MSTSDGRIDFVAVSPFDVEPEINKFYHDLNCLLEIEMSIEQVFFYAAILHLVFVKIYLWNDGNGRSAILVEKWVFTQKLRDKALFAQSKKNVL